MILDSDSGIDDLPPTREVSKLFILYVYFATIAGY